MHIKVIHNHNPNEETLYICSPLPLGFNTNTKDQKPPYSAKTSFLLYSYEIGKNKVQFRKEVKRILYLLIEKKLES